MANEGHIKLGRLFGFPIGLHYSWFILFILVVVSLSQGFFPTCAPEGAWALHWVLGTITALLFFASVLAHELAHSLVARANGIAISGIDLFVFGGVAKLEEEPRTAAQEAKLAIVGPLMSALLAVLFYGVARVTNGDQTYVGCAALRLAWINAALAVFNLVPAFPLDGGRVLRAALWHWMGDLRRATWIASGMGRMFGYLLIGYGVFGFFFGVGLGGIWFVFIGWFLLQAADASYHQLVIREGISGTKIEDLMDATPTAIPGDTPISDAVNRYFLRHDGTAFPVTEGEMLVGLLNVDAIRTIPQDQWATTLARDLVADVNSDLLLSPSDGAEFAWQRINRAGDGALLVVDGDRLVGVVGHAQLLRYVGARLRLGM